MAAVLSACLRTTSDRGSLRCRRTDPPITLQVALASAFQVGRARCQPRIGCLYGKCAQPSTVTEGHAVAPTGDARGVQNRPLNFIASPAGLSQVGPQCRDAVRLLVASADGLQFGRLINV